MSRECRVRGWAREQRIASEACDARQAICRGAAFRYFRDHSQRFPQAAVVVFKVGVSVEVILRRESVRVCHVLQKVVIEKRANRSGVKICTGVCAGSVATLTWSGWSTRPLTIST